MALIVSIEQAAANALTAWIASQMTDCFCSPRWADASMEYGQTLGKAITVLYTGDPTVDYVSDDEVVGRTNTSATRADFRFLRSSFNQPYQIDVWATSEVERDDIVARLKDALNASEGATLGRTNADPFRDGVLVAMGDGRTGYADFLFDSAQKSDTADANARQEFRATYRGVAQLTESSVANRARLRPTLHLNAHTTDAAAALGELAMVSTGGAATYFDDLSLTGITPPSVPTSGGAVTVAGTGFRPGSTVLFDGAAAFGVTVLNPGTLTVTAPAHAAGAATVTVATPGPNGASATWPLGYLPDPTITGLTPASLPATVATALTIDGTGFVLGAGTTVAVGGTAATSVVVVSAARVTCVAPTHAAGSANVVVTNPSGQATAGSALTYVAAPTLASFATSAITSTQAYSDQPTNVTITGTGFVTNTTFKLNGVLATNIVITNATTATCTTAPQPAGSQIVVVTTPDTQQGSSAIAFASTLSMVGAPLVWFSARNGVSTSGSTVTAVADQSGNGKNATSIANATWFASSAIGGGKPAFHFNANGWIENNALSSTDPITVYVVANETQTATVAGLFDSSGVYPNRYAYYYDPGSSQHHQALYSADCTSPGAALASTGEVVCGLYDVAAGHPIQAYRQNSTTAVGSLQWGNSGNVTPFSGFIIGALGGHTNGWTGDVADGLAFSGYHAQPTRAAIMGMLAYQSNISGVA
jgi:hypothetical protein